MVIHKCTEVLTGISPGRALAISGVIILFGLLPIALVSGCQQQAPPVSPSPPTPSQSPPEPQPPPTEPSPEVPHYDIKLISFNGVREGPSPKEMQLYFSGKVRNDSEIELKAVNVIITSYRENGEILAIDRWSTNPWVIQPGETAEFSIRVDDYINAVRYKVSFDHLEEGILDLAVASGVSAEFVVSR